MPGCAVREITADFIYLLAVKDPLSKTELDHVSSLLDASGPFSADGGFIVIPRKGTISPWSSKATDILHNCGLSSVSRAERGICFRVFGSGPNPLAPDRIQPALEHFHDRMVEGVYTDVSDCFDRMEPAPMRTVNLLHEGLDALRRANTDMGLALSEEEIAYLHNAYLAAGRNPTDVELLMFGQVNSEHCRHKIFNADWILDGNPQDKSLFAMIRNTHQANSRGTIVAYKDNSAVIEGFRDKAFEVTPDATRRYAWRDAILDIIMKVETHNHPTAIAPYPGAATGVGGEIRDESATGRGSKSKAGLSAFIVSNLRVPGYVLPWERNGDDFPARLATPLMIMTEGPLGGARFGNEYGRPQLFGLFKTYEDTYLGRRRAYHKPIMVAGGMGWIKRDMVKKHSIPPGSLIVQIGGPAMRIGLGGGAASSMATGSNAEDLDFDSVQRDNAEMQRRCQEVIDACVALDDRNPILSIHDIGAGGLSNGCPELVAETGGEFWLRRVHNEDISMSPREIWCCEAQERYVLAILPESEAEFLAMCGRERCEVAVIGRATADGLLVLHDEHFANDPIHMDIRVLLGKPPRMLRDVRRLTETHPPFEPGNLDLREAADRVLRMPAVSDKTFLITIADRSITGLVARDQMVGPYQTPVSDVAVTATSLRSHTGEAMTMGERVALALVNAPASGRMAVAEAITNIAAADIGDLGVVKLSANWMCACGEEGEDANLFDTVSAVAMDFCPRLGVSIPVGKDSLSMRTLWKSRTGEHRKAVSPLSLIVSAFAPVRDVRKTATPDLKPGASRLLLVDLGRGRNRLGGSALAQAYNAVGSETPDANAPEDIAGFFTAVQELLAAGRILAYHDRSDGGVFATLTEMAFGARRGLDVTLPCGNMAAAMFSEELGAVLQVREADAPDAMHALKSAGLGDCSFDIGAPSDDGKLTIRGRDGAPVYSEDLGNLRHAWSELSFRMQSLRDNPDCAGEEYEGLTDASDPGMSFHLSYDPGNPPSVVASRRPRMAILREQGINGQVEMAAAFDTAGFESVDVHMTDLLSGRLTLDGFAGLVACGGFSYGDVLGAGSGWAKSILFNNRLKDMFQAFFARPETFALGVCNGCQMLSQLKTIIPGADTWPAFTRNRCEQFEARYVTVEIMPSPSVLLTGMEGSRIGVPVAHGEGFADFSLTGSLEKSVAERTLCARFVDNLGRPAERYPLNPNGSPAGVTGFTTADGRVTIMMPHPERAFRSVQLSYAPPDWRAREPGPWLRMFQNARAMAG